MHSRPALRSSMLVGRSLTIGELLDECTDARLGLKLFTAPHGKIISNRVGSWRGVYAEAALEPVGNWLDTDRYGVMETVADLRDGLNRLLNEEFLGYKGGTYRYDRRTPLWFSPHDEARNTGPIDVIEHKTYFVVVMWPIGSPEEWG